MAIRLRRINGRMVALCAAKSSPEPGDTYLDDGMHEALVLKFCGDFKSMGFYHGSSDYDPSAVELGAT